MVEMNLYVTVHEQMLYTIQQNFRLNYRIINILH